MDRLLKIIVAVTLMVILSPSSAFAELTKKDREEIRAIVREEVSREVEALRREMNARFEGIENEMDAKFGGIENEMNARFEEIDKRFNWLYLLLSSIIALIGIMVGAVIWLAKQDRPVSMKHYNEIIERESYLEKELSKLKKAFTEHQIMVHKEEVMAHKA